MTNSGKLKIVNELDPANEFYKEAIAKFLSYFDQTYMDRSKPKGPDYLIIDNFFDVFQDMQESDLINARKEAELISDQICNAEKGFKSTRCDSFLRVTNLDIHGQLFPALTTISYSMRGFRHFCNELSQAEAGDKTLQVDKEELVLTRFNGASKRKQNYLRHKDSYIHDENNQIHGTELRKLTLVIFLNDDHD